MGREADSALDNMWRSTRNVPVKSYAELTSDESDQILRDKPKKSSVKKKTKRPAHSSPLSGIKRNSRAVAPHTPTGQLHNSIAQDLVPEQNAYSSSYQGQVQDSHDMPCFPGSSSKQQGYDQQEYATHHQQHYFYGSPEQNESQLAQRNPPAYREPYLENKQQQKYAAPVHNSRGTFGTGGYPVVGIGSEHMHSKYESHHDGLSVVQQCGSGFSPNLGPSDQQLPAIQDTPSYISTQREAQYNVPHLRQQRGETRSYAPPRQHSTQNHLQCSPQSLRYLKPQISQVNQQLVQPDDSGRTLQYQPMHEGQTPVFSYDSRQQDGTYHNSAKDSQPFGSQEMHCYVPPSYVNLRSDVQTQNHVQTQIKYLASIQTSCLDINCLGSSLAHDSQGKIMLCGQQSPRSDQQVISEFMNPQQYLQRQCQPKEPHHSIELQPQTSAYYHNQQLNLQQIHEDGRGTAEQRERENEQMLQTQFEARRIAHLEFLQGLQDFRFMDLPREVRNMIYQFVVQEDGDSPHIFRLSVSGKTINASTVGGSRAPLLCINKLIHNEFTIAHYGSSQLAISFGKEFDIYADTHCVLQTLKTILIQRAYLFANLQQVTFTVTLEWLRTSIDDIAMIVAQFSSLLVVIISVELHAHFHPALLNWIGATFKKFYSLYGVKDIEIITRGVVKSHSNARCMATTEETDMHYIRAMLSAWDHALDINLTKVGFYNQRHLAAKDDMLILG